MNTGQIKAEVAAHFDPQANTSGRVLTWINAEYGDLVSRRLWSWTERIAALNAVAGQSAYSIVGNTSIPDFRSIVDVTWVGQSPKDLERIESRLFDKITSGVSIYTTTVGSTASSAATVNVVSTAGYPTVGYAWVGSWIVSYTGITATTLTGVSGIGGTTAANSVVRTILTAVNPVAYTIGGGAPEASSSAAVAGGAQNLSVFPAPAVSVPGAIQVRHFRGTGSAELNADGDIPMIPTRHHDVLVELAVGRGMQAMGEPGEAQTWYQRADTRVQAMIAEDDGMRRGDPDEIAEKPRAA